MIRFVSALLIAACATGVTYAQDTAELAKADEVLEKTWSQIYAPKKHGLKDIKFQVSSPMLDPMLGTAKMMFYWKAAPKKPNDLSTIKLEGAGAAPDNPMLEGMVKNMAKGFAAFLSGDHQKGSEQHKLYMKHSTRTLTEVDGKYVVTIKRKADAPADIAGLQENSVLTIDKEKFRILKAQTKVQGQDATITPIFKEIEIDGKKWLLLAGQKMPMVQVGGDVEVEIKWEQKEKIYVPTAVIQKLVTQGMEVNMTFKDHQVNKGVEDTVFAKK